MPIAMAISLSACNDAVSNSNEEVEKPTKSSADITIGNTNHHFSQIECSEGFTKDLFTVLKNDEIYFEVSQSNPSQGTWNVKYAIHLDDNKLDEYFTRQYDLNRDGNIITGSATADRGTVPKKTVDIQVNVVCPEL